MNSQRNLRTNNSTLAGLLLLKCFGCCVVFFALDARFFFQVAEGCGLFVPCFGCWVCTRAPAASKWTSHQDPILQRCRQYFSTGDTACAWNIWAICCRLTSSGFSKSLLPVISQHRLQNPNLCPPGWPLSLSYLSWTCGTWICLQGFAFNIAGYYRPNFHHMAFPPQLPLQEIAYRCRDLSLRLFPTSLWPQWIILLTLFLFSSAAISCCADFHFFFVHSETCGTLTEKSNGYNSGSEIFHCMTFANPLYLWV